MHAINMYDYILQFIISDSSKYFYLHHHQIRVSTAPYRVKELLLLSYKPIHGNVFRKSFIFKTQFKLK